MYNKEKIRNVQCWRCKHKGEYEWKTPRWPGEKVPNSKKLFCNKTKRWGNPERAYYCKSFLSNSNSYTGV